VPLEATLSSPPPKPPISRFKASRLTSASSNLSLVPGPTVKGAVRTGKLENGKLVDLNAISDDEDENVQGAIELLKRGIIQNDVGPLPDTNVSSEELPSATNPTLEPSKFNLASNSVTHISDVQMSSPKMTSSQPVVKHQVGSNADSVGSLDDAKSLKITSPSVKPVDSRSSVPSDSHQHAIIDSPSFPPPSRPRQPPPVMSSTVRERKGIGNHNEDKKGNEKKVSRFLAGRM
jgi:hypothetical protein